jgi:hypothetical protein
MTDGGVSCAFIVDCSGLHEIATTRSNSIKETCLDYLSKGIIGVPACVWKEFVELYEDEAVKLEPHIANKVRMKRRYLVGGAAIADGLNPGFSLSPYDLMTDYYAASICSIEGHTLITVASQLAEYRKMRCCEVVDLGTWAAGRQ